MSGGIACVMSKYANEKSQFCLSPEKDQPKKKALTKIETLHDVQNECDRPNTGFLDRIGNEDSNPQYI